MTRRISQKTVIFIAAHEKRPSLVGARIATYKMRKGRTNHPGDFDLALEVRIHHSEWVEATLDIKWGAEENDIMHHHY